MSIEAMKQALEALEDVQEMMNTSQWFNDRVTALSKAIEQAEKQKPVGEIVQAFDDLVAVSIPVMPPVGTKLYTSPVQAEKQETICPRCGATLVTPYGWQSVANPTEWLDDLRGGADD